MPPKPSSHANMPVLPQSSQPVTSSSMLVGSNNHVAVQQAAAQAAAMLTVPYITSDSDDDDQRLPLLNSNTNPPPKSCDSTNPQSSVDVTQQLSQNVLPPTEPICQTQNHSTAACVTSVSPKHQPIESQSLPSQPQSIVPKSESLLAKPDVATTENDGTSQNRTEPTTNVGNTQVVPTQNNDPDENPPTTDQNEGTTAEDTINVSRSCLDGVVEQMKGRIAELEQIRERKRQRVERLCSAARMAQNAPNPMWPQSAAIVAAQNVLGNRAATPTVSTAVPTNFVPPTTTPKVVVPPPPAPPPAPDGNTSGVERKQSRYWTPDEHKRFLAAVETCGAKNYVRIAELVGTRNAKQVRTHAQKFQKKVEREAAKRQDDLRRHGGAAAANSVSAAAMAAVAAAAATMHQGAPFAADSTYAHAHLLLPYAHGVPLMMANGVAPPGAGGLKRPNDGSSSTNEVSVDHQYRQEPFVAPETVAAAVAAEAAALNSRVYSRPQIAQKTDANKDASANTNGMSTNETTTGTGAGAAEGEPNSNPTSDSAENGREQRR